MCWPPCVGPHVLAPMCWPSCAGPHVSAAICRSPCVGHVGPLVSGLLGGPPYVSGRPPMSPASMSPASMSPACDPHVSVARMRLSPRVPVPPRGCSSSELELVAPGKLLGVAHAWLGVTDRDRHHRDRRRHGHRSSDRGRWAGPTLRRRQPFLRPLLWWAERPLTDRSASHAGWQRGRCRGQSTWHVRHEHARERGDHEQAADRRQEHSAHDHASQRLLHLGTDSR